MATGQGYHPHTHLYGFHVPSPAPFNSFGESVPKDSVLGRLLKSGFGVWLLGFQHKTHKCYPWRSKVLRWTGNFDSGPTGQALYPHLFQANVLVFPPSPFLVNIPLSSRSPRFVILESPSMCLWTYTTYLAFYHSYLLHLPYLFLSHWQP